MAKVAKKVTKKKATTRKKQARKTNSRDAGVVVSNKSVKTININVVNNSIDVYSSPYLIDLSQVKYIERVRPIPKVFDVGFYNSLPGSDFLSKFYVWELLSFENSEILIYFNNIWRKISSKFKKTFRKVEFVPKLPLVKNDGLLKNNWSSLWQEVALVNIFVFIFQGIRDIKFYYKRLFNYLGIKYKSKFTKKDEIINFSLREIPVIKKDVKLDYVLDKAWTPTSNIERKKESKKPIFIFNLPKIKIPKITFPQIIWPEFRIPKLSLEFQPSSFYFKSVFWLVFLALLVILPFKTFNYWKDVSVAKGEILGQTDEAIQNLKFAQVALFDFNIVEASKYFSSANINFVSAKNQLDEIKSFIIIIARSLPNSTLKSGKNLLDLGERLTSAGEYLLNGLNELINDDKLSLTSKIKNFQIELDYAQGEITKAKENLDKINISHIPEENRVEFEKLRKSLPAFVSSIEESGEIINFAINFLGDNDLKRYLVIFQNDNELRATGGFMGSFALIDIQSGEIVNIELPKGGTYDLEAGLKDLIEPPPALTMINQRWEFQDTNWWPDWPTSAKNITWFYNRSGGPTIDGVIAINSDWFGNVLDVVGRVDLPEYDKTLTASNFEQELQKSVEIEYEDRTKPKAILGDLATAILEKIFNIEPENMLELVSFVGKGLEEKDILIYLEDEELEKFVAKNNWDGRIKDAPKDYLSVVATNIGGGKTDNNIKQDIYHQAKILNDGSIIDEVIISRHHFGPTDEIFTNYSNRSYLRVYVPNGSQFISAAGFHVPAELGKRKIPDYLQVFDDLKKEKLAMTDTESQTKIYQENNKTVFANWVNTRPGETNEVVLTYKLPFKLNLESDSNSGLLDVFTSQDSYDSYSLVIQKQSGSNDDNIISSLIFDEKLTVNQTYSDLEKEPGKIIFTNKIDKDLFYFVNFKY